MAPVAHATRTRLLDEAERLLARRGIEGVTTREIVEAAEQRNASAVSYHFGSRQGLLLEVLARRGGPIDVERGRLRAALGPRPSVGDLVACLVVPYAALLERPEGRSYLQIVAQLRGRFAAWRVESDVETTRHLAAVLDELESRPAAPLAVRRERVVGLIMLLTAAVAERARRIDDHISSGIADDLAHDDLDHDDFVANLVAMCAALITT